jgi:branched-chain amino acid transport system permease protein
MATETAAKASVGSQPALNAGFILKKALISAAVAFGLFAMMIGVRTEAAGTSAQLAYWTRFGDLAAIVAAVFGGSILIELLRHRFRHLEPSSLVPRQLDGPLALVRRLAAPALLGFTLLVPVFFYDQRFVLDIAILVLTYVMLGWGLNVVVGLAGLLDLGYVAFYAVGAYSYALLATTFGLSFSPASLPPSAACCSAFPCCDCAATISPSSPSPSARSSA